jgi:malonyl-CoA O-methyltransferase
MSSLSSDFKTGQLKDQVAQNFGTKAEDYNKYAIVQREAASRLAELAGQFICDLNGTYIELGCGTGFVTQYLCEILEKGAFEITDLSPEMLKACRIDLTNPNGLKLTFQIRDAESPLPENSYDLILNALTAQWFTDLDSVFKGWLKALKPGGMLIYSFLDNRCFPEWKKLCEDANLPFSANKLPAPIPLNLNFEHYEWEFFTTEIYTETFESPSEFFKNLKRIGAGTKTNTKTKTGSQESVAGTTSKINEYWTSLNKTEFQVSYGITFGGIRRKGYS